MYGNLHPAGAPDMPFHASSRNLLWLRHRTNPVSTAPVGPTFRHRAVGAAHTDIDSSMRYHPRPAMVTGARRTCSKHLQSVEVADFDTPAGATRSITSISRASTPQQILSPVTPLLSSKREQHPPFQTPSALMFAVTPRLHHVRDRPSGRRSNHCDHSPCRCHRRPRLLNIQNSSASAPTLRCR